MDAPLVQPDSLDQRKGFALLAQFQTQAALTATVMEHVPDAKQEHSSALIRLTALLLLMDAILTLTTTWPMKSTEEWSTSAPIVPMARSSIPK